MDKELPQLVCVSLMHALNKRNTSASNESGSFAIAWSLFIRTQLWSMLLPLPSPPYVLSTNFHTHDHTFLEP